MLVATLWALAGLAILAAYIDGVAAAHVVRGTQAKQSLARELDRRSTEATLLYLLATNRMNHRALILDEQQTFVDRFAEDARLPSRGDGELTVTGEVYAGLGETRFSLQDENGLVSVNSPRFPPFAAALESAGLSSQDAVLLVARTRDYVDLDQTLSLNGAERVDYRLRGLPPPPDWIMASYGELRSVLGIGELVTAEQWRKLRPMLTMRQAICYNFNTMTPAVLAALVGSDESAVRPLIEERRDVPIRGLEQVARATGSYLAIDPMELCGGLPSSYLRIATWVPGGSRHLAGIWLTPLGERAPWRKDYEYSQPVIDDDDPTTSYGHAAPAREAPRRPATPLFQQAGRHPDA